MLSFRFLVATAVVSALVLASCSQLSMEAAPRAGVVAPSAASTVATNTSANASNPLPSQPTSQKPTPTVRQGVSEQSIPQLSVGSKSPEVAQLHILLAQLGYLPLTWTPAAKQTTNVTSSVYGAPNPSKGTWHWTYQNTPTSLKGLWSPNVYNLITKGAVMTFEAAKGIEIDGIAGPHVWNAIRADVSAKRRNHDGYSYVYVSESRPETLKLWWSGRYVLTSLANTGIAQSPTERGTWPVYLRYTSQTMSGYTPSGQYYRDPGVPWVNYFHGGDAVHGFIRKQYGFPQSLGCVELPITNAKIAWQYMRYGTLVTVGW